MTLLGAIIIILIFAALLGLAKWGPIPAWLRTGIYIAVGIGLLLAVIALVVWALAYFGVFAILGSAHLPKAR
jgi:hypothetical protein